MTAAQKASRERQMVEQSNVMRDLLNKISEKLSGSNWVAHCRQRVRPVPTEFWANSRIEPGRCVYICVYVYICMCIFVCVYV